MANVDFDLENGIDDFENEEGESDIDDFSEEDGQDGPDYTEEPDYSETGDEGEGENEEQESDFETTLLKSIGINDKSKIKFENEAGEIEEVDWNDLSDQEKYELVSSSRPIPEEELDDDEIELINAIRSSDLNPQEYINQIAKTSVDNYLNNNNPGYNLQVDQISDDDLFMADFISRMGDDISDDEVTEALENAKQNENLYQRQIKSLRDQYRTMEMEDIQQAQAQQEAAAQQQYQQFSNAVVAEINNLKDIQGVDLNMDNSDMQELYDYITGVDGAGQNYFAKTLADPKMLVKAAWLTLNADQMIYDINDYYRKEIAKTKRDSYKQGQEDAKKGVDNSKTFIRTKKNKRNAYNDLDEF